MPSELYRQQPTILTLSIATFFDCARTIIVQRGGSLKVTPSTVTFVDQAQVKHVTAISAP